MHSMNRLILVIIDTYIVYLGFSELTPTQKIENLLSIYPYITIYIQHSCEYLLLALYRYLYVLGGYYITRYVRDTILVYSTMPHPLPTPRFGIWHLALCQLSSDMLSNEKFNLH